MTTDKNILLAERQLAATDPALGALIVRHGHLNRQRGEGHYFASLARSIVSQQISVAAARSILGRVEAATDLDPQRILARSPDELRALGLSRSKGTYIWDLASHFANEPTVFDHLERLSDDEVVAELVKVKCI